MHLSFSQLDTFTRCAKKFQLQRIQQAPEKGAVWLPAGSSVHEAIELVNRRFFHITTTPQELPHDRGL